MRISHGRYYYQFHETVEKLRKEDDSCFICGSTKNVKPHHIRRVKESDPRYANQGNIVLLCPRHHHKFHKLYGSGKGVNRHNFDIFVKREHLREINRLKKELNEYKNNINGIVLAAIGKERTCIGTNVLCELAEQLDIKIEEE